MSKPLVIVESPAKAKTIAQYLGDEFDVRSSVGHIADLPSKGLAVDVENGFKPNWELTVRGKEVVKELKLLMKNASVLYLATDEDREGEAISWHLLEHLKPKVEVHRMVFHEINKRQFSKQSPIHVQLITDLSTQQKLAASWTVSTDTKCRQFYGVV